jgi:hypothetical protein
MIVPHGLNPHYLGCYGSESIHTPAIDRMATEGILFDQHYADHPDGLCPCQFDFSACYHFEGDRDAFLTFHDSGFAMARIITADLEMTGSAPGKWPRTRSVEVGADWRAHLRKVFQETIKLIAEFSQMARWLIRIDLGILLAGALRPESSTQDKQSGNREPDGEKNIYGQMVECLDSGMQELRLELQKAGLLEVIHMVVSSYRGQDLGEFGSFRKWRGPFLHQELVHLPLIWRMPTKANAGRRVAVLTQPMDLTLTLAKLLGLSIQDGHGAGLLPLLGGEIRRSRDYVYSYLHVPRNQNWALRTNHWCLLQSEPAQGGVLDDPSSQSLLFKKPEDQWEVNDLYGLEPSVAQDLRKTLKHFRTSKCGAGPNLNEASEGGFT